MASFSTNSSQAIVTSNPGKYSTRYTQDSGFKLKKGVIISPSENPSTPEFAYELLQAELRLETNQGVDQKLVMKLFELYRLAVEYYNQRKHPRQLVFKKKMDSLINNPVVLGALHQSQSCTDTFYKKKQIQKLVQMDHKKSFHANQLVTSALKNEIKVQTTLKQQSDIIQKRIKQRRASKKSFQGDSLAASQISQATPRKKTKTICTKPFYPQNENKSKNLLNSLLAFQDI